MNSRLSNNSLTTSGKPRNKVSMVFVKLPTKSTNCPSIWSVTDLSWSPTLSSALQVNNTYVLGDLTSFFLFFEIANINRFPFPVQTISTSKSSRPRIPKIVIGAPLFTSPNLVATCIHAICNPTPLSLGKKRRTLSMYLIFWFN